MRLSSHTSLSNENLLMSCLEQNCLCDELCEVNNSCILSHELLNGNTNLVSNLLSIGSKARAKYIISLLQSIKPPKVSDQQVDQYKKRKKITGFNPDRKPVIKWQKQHL